MDREKAEANRKNLGISFEEASSACADPLSLLIADPDHSEREQRMLLLGRSAEGRLLVVSDTERGSRIRLISARPGNRRERRDYEESPG